MRKIRQGGNQATREPPLRAAAIWHRENTQRTGYLPSDITCAPTHDSREGGEGARIREDSLAQS